MRIEAIRVRRAAGQRLDAQRELATAAEVVRHMVAVQAQDLAAARLGVATRADDLTAAAVEHARSADRSIVRLWCLRGTLHLVPAEDVYWLLDLVRPRLTASNRRRRLELGLDEAATERGVRVIAESVRVEGPLTRAELAARLDANGIASAGQATIHVIWRAALDGLVCYGPEREGAETFVSLPDWFPSSGARTPEKPVQELAERYVAAYGPATAEDFAAWSGLPRAEVDRMWRNFPLETVGASPSVVRLLPAFDSVWLAYRDHRVELDQRLTPRVFPGGGVIRPLVYLDGRIVGTWSRRTSRAGAIDVTVELFEQIEDDALSAAVQQLGGMLDATARLAKRSLV